MSANWGLGSLDTLENVIIDKSGSEVLAGPHIGPHISTNGTGDFPERLMNIRIN